MALTIETGTASATSNSYISAADATTYHSARGNTLWTGADSVKEAALLKAAAYLDGHYRKRWKGQKVYPITQAMEWPRVGVRVVDTPQPYHDVPPSFYDNAYSGFLAITTIPQRLKDAQCELALRALTGELSADGTGNIKREKVDVLETEYFAGTVPKQVFPVVDQLLSDYLTPLGCGSVTRG